MILTAKVFSMSCCVRSVIALPVTIPAVHRATANGREKESESEKMRGISIRMHVPIDGG
jgi:hypothetical protein